MALLDSKNHEEIFSNGKKAIIALNENNLQKFEMFAEETWDLFPSPKNNWNEGYNFAKSIFKGALLNQKYDLAKVWLMRMKDNNDFLHLYDGECEFFEGKYYFETKDYNQSLEKFKYVVEDAGFRYFEGEDPKYLDFYRNPEKYIK